MIEHGFELLHRGRVLSAQAVRVETAAEGKTSYAFYWQRGEGRGGSVSEAARLVVAPDGRPRRYTLYSSVNPVCELVFGLREVEVRLADGSARTVPLEAPVDFVLQHNLILQLTLGLKLRRGGGNGAAKLCFFSPESLRTGWITAEPGPDSGCVRTDLGGIEIEVDPDGWPLALTVAGDSSGALGGRATLVRMPDDVADLASAAPLGPPVVGTDFGAIEDLTIDSLAGPLRATLWLPPTRVHATCLFLQGSGLIDRFGRTRQLDLGSTALFRALAREAGIAILSVDARGAGDTGFGPPELNPYDIRLADARIALRWLAGDARTRAVPCVLVGHSLGALIALLLAAPDDGEPQCGIDAIVLLAPPGRPLWRVLARQAGDQVNTAGTRLRGAARRKFFATLRRHLEHRAPDSPTAPWGLGALLESAVATRDPAKLLERITVPVLICFGEQDTQVPPRAHVPLFARAARVGTRTIEIDRLPALDHLFHPTAPSPGVAPPPLAAADVDGSLTMRVTAWLCATLELRAGEEE